jgi:hypothetical protein
MLEPAFNAKLLLATSVYGPDQHRNIYNFIEGTNFCGEQIGWFDERGMLLKPVESLGAPDDFFNEVPRPRFRVR